MKLTVFECLNKSLYDICVEDVKNGNYKIVNNIIITPNGILFENIITKKLNEKIRNAKVMRCIKTEDYYYIFDDTDTPLVVDKNTYSIEYKNDNIDLQYLDEDVVTKLLDVINLS